MRKRIFTLWLCCLVLPLSVSAQQPAAPNAIELQGSFTAISPDGKVIVTNDNLRLRSHRFWNVETGRAWQQSEGNPTFWNFGSFSPDGKQFVAMTGYYTFRVWDTESGKTVQTFEGHRGGGIPATTPPSSVIRSARFSPDGKRIVTAGNDNTARIWDVESGKELQTLEGHNNRVHIAAFSSDGKNILTAASNGSRSDQAVRIWDAETGKELHKLEGHTGNIRSAAFSPDGKKIVTAASTIRIWETVSGRKLHQLEGHEYLRDSVGLPLPFSATFSPDGKKIVTAGYDGTVRIWDAESGRQLQSLEGHKRELGDNPRDALRNFVRAGFSPDSTKIRTVGSDGTARIWDVASGSELKKWDVPVTYGTVRFSPDGRAIMSIDGRVTSAPRGGVTRIFDWE